MPETGKSKSDHAIALAILLISQPVFSQSAPATDPEATQDTAVINRTNIDSGIRPNRSNGFQLVEPAYESAMRSLHSGDYRGADIQLRQLVEHVPQHAGAWLDLALLQCDLGNTEVADRLFRDIETRFMPPPSILEVIAWRRLQGCKRPPQTGQWSFRLGRGRDSNVNQGASDSRFALGNGDYRIELSLLPDYLPKADSFTTISVDHVVDAPNQDSHYFFRLQNRQHDRWSRYDITAVTAGGERRLQIGDNIPVHLGANLGGMTLGNRWYQQQIHLYAALPLNPVRMIRQGTLPDRSQFVVAHTLVQYPEISGFDANIWELRGQFFHHHPAARIHLALSWLFDAAQDNRPGGNRQGWQFIGQLRLPGPGNSHVELGWQEQYWRSHKNYSPGLIDQHRQQHTRTFHAAFNLPITSKHSLIMEYKNTFNQESISIFQYHSNVYQLNWQWLY